MALVEPTFAEEFYIDDDPRMLALDFWSYINARQANLGWSEPDHRLWWHLEETLTEVKPVLVDPRQERFRPFLLDLVERWKSPKQVPVAQPGAAEEAHLVRRELADMLAGALSGPEDSRTGADDSTRRSVVSEAAR
jgi:hypothetical protein